MKLLNHGDPNWQYASEKFQKVLKNLQITCSLSRASCCYRDAVAERLTWSLKNESPELKHVAELIKTFLSVFRYTKSFYNPIRLRRTLK